MQTPIKVAIIGTGKLGLRHAQTYMNIPGVTICGVCDVNPDRAHEAALLCNTRAYHDYKELLDVADAASIVVPSEFHYAVSRDFLEKGVHLLIEKPITTSLADADDLLTRARRKDLILQVGHIERFNSAIRSIKDVIRVPRFIECQRLGSYDPRVAKTGVVLDLMIHDIDIVLDLVRSPIETVDCVGAYVLSETEDFANARIRFSNGCVCALTASRVSPDRERKVRIFQEDAYIALDYLHQEVDIYRKADQAINHQKIEIKKSDALKEELTDFVRCVRENSKPLVSGAEGRNALALALDISERIERLYKKK